jgi:aminocarboxymuconate-semialdehyde decarboxylase
VHDTGSLDLLIKNQGSQQVLVGLDDPYPLGEMESDKQSSYPGKLLDLAMKRDIITEKEHDQMWEDNVLNWLYGDDQAGKEALVKKILAG